MDYYSLAVRKVNTRSAGKKVIITIPIILDDGLMLLPRFSGLAPPAYIVFRYVITALVLRKAQDFNRSVRADVVPIDTRFHDFRPFHE